MMTISEKILAAHSNRDVVSPGDLLQTDIDFAFANDMTGPLAIEFFEKAGGIDVFDNNRIALILDHFVPSKDIHSARNCKLLRTFSTDHKITHFFDVGRSGIEHAFLPEQGLVLPGELVVGADSHTCTYGALGALAFGVGSSDLGAAILTGKTWVKVPASIKIIFTGNLKTWVCGKDLILYVLKKLGTDGAIYKAIEFDGEVIKKLPIDDRFTICNMAAETGAKTAIIKPDDITESYLRGRARRDYKFCHPDSLAIYESTFEWDVSHLTPLVACPHKPDLVVSVEKLKDVNIDQVVIGSCTNGRIGDLRIAASILKNRSISPNVRCILIPATQEIYLEALKDGLIQTFIDSKVIISPPTCGPCLGGHMGVLSEGDVALSTTNRNFRGRMGHERSEIYLSSPAVAAASAVAGRITHPEEIVGDH
jgi:3-isopropylmalate/(R)-2-methylmalate dehydratase large subunit